MDEICLRKNCTGCAACVNICPEKCIKMKKDDEGFDYPEIDKTKCIDCRLCQKICKKCIDVFNDKNYPLEVFAAWSLDERVRCSSSSGGVFFEFARGVLEQGGCVVGAAFVEDLKVAHILVENQEELVRLQGSKYVQSEIGNIYQVVKQRLSQGQRVLFSGTPCQVAALYAFLGTNRHEGLLTADVVCHGVPSPGLFESYVRELKNRFGPDIENYCFRDSERWDFLCSTINLSGTKIVLKGEQDIYMKAFLKGYLHRTSCYTCPYACIPRVGDITFADFWGIGEKNPFPYSTSKGVSLLLINSHFGQKALDRIQHRLFLERRPLEEATVNNQQLVCPDIKPKFRDSFYVDYQKLSWSELEKKYRLKRTIIQKLQTKLKSLKIFSI